MVFYGREELLKKKQNEYRVLFRRMKKNLNVIRGVTFLAPRIII